MARSEAKMSANCVAGDKLSKTEGEKKKDE